MEIVSDHGFPKGSMPDDDAFDRFKNERDYVTRFGQMKTTVAAMDWAAAEIKRLTAENTRLADACLVAVQERDELQKQCGHRAQWMARQSGRLQEVFDNFDKIHEEFERRKREGLPYPTISEIDELLRPSDKL